MKRKSIPARSSLLLACLAAVASGAAGAQSSGPAANVTLYGLLDAGVEFVNHVGTAGSLARIPTNSNSAPSRWGFRGSESLGNGLNAVFTLESGMAMDNGGLAQGGRLFGRQAFVGVSGPFGTVSLGRQYTMTFWSGIDADIHGGGIYGTGSLDSYLPNARADNAIAWRGTFSGLQLGAQYSLGRDAVNAGPSPAGTNCAGESTDTRACRQWSVMAKYDTPTWGVALANDRMNGRNVGAAPDAIFGGLTTSARSDNRLTVNGWARFGAVKVGGGVIRRNNDGLPTRPKTDLIHLGATYDLSSAWMLSAQYVTLRYRGVSGFNSGLLGVRATYNLSKRTAVFGQIGLIDNDASAAVSVSGGAPGSNPVAGARQTGLNFGIRHAF